LREGITAPLQSLEKMALIFFPSDRDSRWCRRLFGPFRECVFKRNGLTYFLSWRLFYLFTFTSLSVIYLATKPTFVLGIFSSV